MFVRATYTEKEARQACGSCLLVPAHKQLRGLANHILHGVCTSFTLARHVRAAIFTTAAVAALASRRDLKELVEAAQASQSSSREQKLSDRLLGCLADGA